MSSTGHAPPLSFAGRYRRIRRLGTGGMARVFLAEDETLGRRVAVKQLPSGAPDEALLRFRREARLGASLNHPNVVSIFDTLSDEDSVLIVMEYVDGESLAERLQRGPLGVEEAMAVLHQASNALDHAPAEGVVHRDVKPSNILLSADGTAKLADLGIATAVDATSITGTGAIIGTLAYIAPERLRGKPGEASADVYSLAAVAFEMLSGRRARPEPTPEELLERLDSGPAPDLREAMPDAPAAAALLAGAMDGDPSKRPGSAGALVAGLEEALRGGGAAVHRSEEATLELPPREPPPREPPPLREDPRPAEREAFVPPPIGRRREGTRLVAPLALGLAAAILIGIVLLAGSGPEKRAPKIGSGSAGRLAKSLAAAEATPSAPAPAAVPPAPAPEPAPSEAAPAPSGASAGTSGAALNSQGYQLIKEGRYAEAVPILQQAVDSFPPGTTEIDYAYALFNLGNALRLAGRPEEAIPVLEQRLQIPNQTGIVRRELALARQEAGGG